MTKKEMILIAREKENWSRNHKYNYGPIDSLSRNWFAGGWTRYKHDTFRKVVRLVTDAKTYFIYLLKAYDIYVRCGEIIWEMQQAFPEVSKFTIYQWLKENKEDHHVYLRY